MTVEYMPCLIGVSPPWLLHLPLPLWSVPNPATRAQGFRVDRDNAPQMAFVVVRLPPRFSFFGWSVDSSWLFAFGFILVPWGFRNYLHAVLSIIEM